MATTSYTIYSHYDPEDSQEVQSELPHTTNPDTWHFDSSFRVRPLPPRFVPATLPPDQWNLASTSSRPDGTEGGLGKNVSTWYRSLRSPTNDTVEIQQPQPSRSAAPETQPQSQPPHSEKANKNNWFIMNAIQSEPSPASTPPPSLAAIIARDPPPLPSEPKYHPPVWLEIGPSNKGFEMLQRRGWNEGEPLGPDVIRQLPRSRDSSSGDMIPDGAQMGNRIATHITETVREIKIEGHDDVSELKRVDVIDLTRSDSEDDSGDDTEDDARPIISRTDAGVQDINQSLEPLGSSHGRTALVTPLPTVLKSDRLGIGLKAKTVGPHKASQKRVTHNAAALAAHIRAGEAMKKRKKETGRGRRGFAKQQKREAAERQQLLAYMNG